MLGDQYEIGLFWMPHTHEFFRVLLFQVPNFLSLFVGPTAKKQWSTPKEKNHQWRRKVKYCTKSSLLLLVASYSTSFSVTVWEYIIQVSKIGVYDIFIGNSQQTRSCKQSFFFDDIVRVILRKKITLFVLCFSEQSRLNPLQPKYFLSRYGKFTCNYHLILNEQIIAPILATSAICPTTMSSSPFWTLRRLRSARPASCGHAHAAHPVPLVWSIINFHSLLLPQSTLYWMLDWSRPKVFWNSEFALCAAVYVS
jgi:hypothetical protein